MKKQLALLFSLLLLSGICTAEPAKKESIEKLFSLMNMDQLLDSVYGQMDSMFSDMTDQMGIPEEDQPIVDKFFKEYTALIRDEMSWDKFKAPMIDAYAKVFTEEEIKEVTKFYQSKVGQKMLEKMPELTQVSMHTVQGTMKDIMPKIQALQSEMVNEIRKRHEEKETQQ